MKHSVGDRVQVKYWLSDYFLWRDAEIRAHVSGSYVVEVDDQAIIAQDDEVRSRPDIRPESTGAQPRAFHDDHTFVYLAASPGKGRGVFAKRHIPKGTTILLDPVIVLSPEEFDLLSVTTLCNHVFKWSHDVSGREADLYCVAFGLGSMINHADAPNVKGRDIHDQLMIGFEATRDIEPDEELFLDYGVDEAERSILGIGSSP